MMCPVRCFTCGKVVADHADEFAERTAKGEDPAKLFDEFGLERYCCKRMLLGHVNLIDEILPYPRF